MRAKTINENIEDLLKGKSEEDIERSLSKLSPQEIVDIGDTNNNLDLIKKGIERGGELSFNQFEDLADYEEYEEFSHWVINYLIEKGGLKNLQRAFHHSIFMNWEEGIKKCLDKLPSYYFKENLTGTGISRGHTTLRYAMNRKVDFETLKLLYNHPKINPSISDKNSLLIVLEENYKRIDLLDKILKE